MDKFTLSGIKDVASLLTEAIQILDELERGQADYRMYREEMHRDVTNALATAKMLIADMAFLEEEARYDL